MKEGGAGGRKAGRKERRDTHSHILLISEYSSIFKDFINFPDQGLYKNQDTPVH